MKYLLFILIITLFVNIEKSHLKCVMYDACTNLEKLSPTGDPLSSRWQNCEYNGEARPIENQEVMDMFKQLCPSLYNGNDKMPLCCSANQIRILRKSIKEAESVIGTCPSCYFNFRNFWCQITCHPEQDKFVVPTIYKLSEYRNFTEQLKMHESAKNQVEEDHEELEHHEEEEELKETEQKPKEKKYTISRMNIYIQREFVSELIESCHDVKLYGSDALQGFCGVPSKQCTPEIYVNHMGLVVTQNPFKVDFYINKTHEEIIPIRQIREVMVDVVKEETHDFTIQPILPKYYKCNESFQFGDLDFGAKCSCKECQASCEIYPEFRIEQKRHFKVGHVDGAVFIMSIAFVIFIALFTRYLFIKKLEPKKIHTNNSISSSMDSTETPSKYQEKSLFTKLLHIICLCPKTPTKLLIPAETEPDSNNTNSSPQKNRSKYKRLIRNRLNKLNCLDKMLFFGDKLERFIELRFQYLGKFCASYPTLVLTIGFAFCSLMCLGYFNFKVEKDPIKLWSADSSIARQNKKYFDENFGPFYRITQLIIEPKKTVTPTHYNNMNITSLKIEILKETFDLYNQLIQIKEPISLDTICFKPLEPENQNCAIQSIFQYFQNDMEKFASLTQSEEDLYKHLQSCMSNPLDSECLSSFGAPIQPYLIIGSYDTTKTEYLNAGALIINFVINNYLNNEDKISKAMQWEFEALKILKNYTSDLINVYYSTERSIEDELERESKADIKIIAISYVVMFVYLTITLGKYSSLNLKVIFLEMKIFLALAGVSLVILSVFSSGGFFASIGVPSTLITLEVIPFLLLAVGVDNVYILVQTYQNDEKLPNESIEDQISRIVGRVGPSMLLTGTTQSAAFLISALTPMPGVRAFSLYASLAIIINFIMQITCFVVLLTLDAKREQSRRIDLLCCFKLNLKNFEIQNRKSFLYKFFKKFYTPILFDYKVRVGVIVVFVGFFFSCLTMCDKLKVGLDQKLTMPQDSYQLKYFEALQKHLSVGPPVYFVLKDGYNYTNLDEIRKLCGSSSCESNSLQNLISSASFFPNETYIAQPPENWIDNYMEWLEATPPSYCCYEYKEKREFCDYIKLDDTQEHECEKCKFERVKYNFPDENSLLKYVKYFLKQNPSRHCIKAGHAMYGDAVRLHQNKNGHVTSIGPSHFMAYHKVLSTSDDFINAMKSAHKISEAINKILNSGTNSSNKIEVFPYSNYIESVGHSNQSFVVKNLEVLLKRGLDRL
ncbi:unnamed protein product [Brachionus calyciflorus]|uniref:SSD domain-containing protein n=1 Tax=Brachionus calyciflorus TaxID=104777 RepID=A0A814H6H4_9BILA|nr:unnamed protein product [Brachionus calyciflorus]